MHDKTEILKLNLKLAKASIKGKSVIFVGPSDLLTDQRQGHIIDDYDLVVRTNSGFRLADTQPLDYGSKCDILYINNFWFRAHIKKNATTHLPRLLKGDIKFIFMKTRSIRALPNHLVSLDATPKFIRGGRIPLKSKLRKLWTKKDKFVEPLQTTHIIHDLLHFKAKKITVTGIDFYEGKTSWNKSYNISVNEAQHAKEREIGHNLLGEKRFMKLCLKKNLVQTDTKIKQLLGLGDPDEVFEVPRNLNLRANS